MSEASRLSCGHPSPQSRTNYAYLSNREHSGVEAGQIRLRKPAYALAVTLFNAGAAAVAVPLLRDMQGPPLSELVAKGVVKRSGATYGRYGEPGAVRMLVARERLVPAASRVSRRPAPQQETSVAKFESLP